MTLTLPDVGLAAQLVGWGLRVNKRPALEPGYRELVRRYLEEPLFRETVRELAGGLGLHVLDVSEHGVALGPAEGSVLLCVPPISARWSALKSGCLMVWCSSELPSPSFREREILKKRRRWLVRLSRYKTLKTFCGASVHAFMMPRRVSPIRLPATKKEASSMPGGSLDGANLPPIPKTVVARRAPHFESSKRTWIVSASLAALCVASVAKRPATRPPGAIKCRSVNSPRVSPSPAYAARSMAQQKGTPDATALARTLRLRWARRSPL